MKIFQKNGIIDVYTSHNEILLSWHIIILRSNIAFEWNESDMVRDSQNLIINIGGENA